MRERFCSQRTNNRLGCLGMKKIFKINLVLVLIAGSLFGGYVPGEALARVRLGGSSRVERVEKSVERSVVKRVVQKAPAYKLHKDIMSTVFWFGEEASFDEENYNGGISNVPSAWEYPYADSSNPYYVAVPYNDLGRDDVSDIPWYDERMVVANPYYSFVKNRWVAVRLDRNVCYGQVEDVGPFVEDDFDYVFGRAKKPKNLVNFGAGLDLSPKMAECLGHDGMERVDWAFVDYEDVPWGAWRLRVETENPNWEK